MAATEKKTLNVYQKLQLARCKFLESNVEKTGKNMHLQFKYFELEDIVPTANRIFQEVGLTQITVFSKEMAFLTVRDVDDPESNIEFFAPFNQLHPIISNEGKAATNEMQALGSSITYMRRYLYMLALDICESDSIDSDKATSGDKPVSVARAEAKAEKKKSAPATQEQRAEQKIKLTGSEKSETGENISAEQRTALMTKLKQLIACDSSQNTYVQKLAVETKGFTAIPTSNYDKLVAEVDKLLKEYQK